MPTPQQTVDAALAAYSRKDTIDPKATLAMVQAVVTFASTAGSGAWGGITGTLSDQTDLNTALGLKATLLSPTFTGTPVAPTVVDGTTDTTQLATTAFVQNALAAYVKIATPKLTSSSTVGFIWTATDTDGNGSWQAATGGGGGGNTIYSADDTLAGNRVVGLNSKTLTFSDASPFIKFSSTTYGANYNTQLGARVDGKGQLILGNDSTNYIQAGTTDGGGALEIWTNCSNPFGVDPNGNLAVTFASTGIATFNKNVIFTHDLTVNGTASLAGPLTIPLAAGGADLIMNGSGNNAIYQKFNNNGGNTYFGVESSTAGSLLGGINGFSTVLLTESATDLVFGTNNTKRMTITAGGEIDFFGAIKPQVFTVATLPTPAPYLLVCVNDATAPVAGMTVSGGGSTNAMVWYNGTAWKVVIV